MRYSFILRQILASSLVFLFLLPLSAKAATLEEMAGQMIMLGFQGQNVNDKSVAQTRLLIEQGKIGAIIYLKFNISSLANVKQMNERFLATGAKLPPLIAIDQEGGAIERLTRDVGFKEIQSAREIARGQSVESAQRIYGAMARELAKLGFNLNLAPVVDLNINKNNPIIARYGRSYSDDSEIVTKYAGAFVKAHRQANMLTSLKHFPGHGSSDKDSHLGFVDISRQWQVRELEPYRKMIKNNLVDMVMIAHLYHEKFSPNDKQLPASLSPNWIKGVLRDNIGFEGVVISDDLEMKAIRDNFSQKETIIRAINAGTDILLFSNTANYRPTLADEILKIIVEEARKNPLFAKQIEQSYARIVALKKKLAK